MSRTKIGRGRRLLTTREYDQIVREGRAAEVLREYVKRPAGRKPNPDGAGGAQRRAPKKKGRKASKPIRLHVGESTTTLGRNSATITAARKREKGAGVVAPTNAGGADV